MRDGPTISHDRFLYARMKALTWLANGLYLPTVIQARAGDMLAKMVSTTAPNMALVINCHGVNAIEDHAFDRVRDSLSKTASQVIFINAAKIEPYIQMWLGHSLATYNIGGECAVIYGNNSISVSEAENLVIREVPAWEHGLVVRCVKASYKPYEGGPTRMASTPLVASGIFNARALVSDRDTFVWLSLFLAERLEDLVARGLAEAAGNLPMRLLAVSLRASPFAVAVRSLAYPTTEVEIVDHMGPSHKILEEYVMGPPRHSAQYVYIGDFLIGGTELKIARTYAQAKASILEHAVVIGTALSPEVYSAEVASLIGLSECGKNIRYEFLGGHDEPG